MDGRCHSDYDCPKRVCVERLESITRLFGRGPSTCRQGTGRRGQAATGMRCYTKKSRCFLGQLSMVLSIVNWLLQDRVRTVESRSRVFCRMRVMDAR